MAAVVLLAGCGAGIPADASVKSFCTTTGTFSTATKFSDGVKAAKKLQDTGTPKGIPGDARDGFELVVQLVTDAKSQADLEKQYNKLTAKQKKSVAALDAYITKTC
jgi:NAD-dependent SIR2 family protein deacetylase